MSIRWPTVPRPSSVDRALEELDEHAGVALLGGDGVGKTTLAGQVAVRLGETSPLRVIGTATQASVPFGAFGSLVEVAEVGKPAALIRSALDSLLAQADNALIIVDDAHLLDPLSATLVYQLAQQPGVRLIVTARSTSPLPGAVAALWEDGLLGRVDLGPMDGDETAAVLAAVPEPVTDPALYRRSAGNPLHLRLLVESGGSSDRSLTALLDDHLGALPAPVRDVLGYQAVHEPLSRTDLTALTSEAAVAQAEA
ncbi:MAG TPA: ATP-binding protein, partial [Mycobacterium sp.]|nr:ATP-binding protein [Mycobacterium sp.]